MRRRLRRVRETRQHGAFGGAALAALLLSGLPAVPAGAQDLLLDDLERFVVIKAGRIIPIAGEEIRNGVIVISDGKIRNVGPGIDYPMNAKVIDAGDRVVMPGLINPQTDLGLPDYRRSGVHGDLTAEQEFYPTEDQFEAQLDAGYTLVALVPSGSDIPGRAMVRRTAGDPNDAVIQSPGYLAVRSSKRELRQALEKARQEIEKVEKAREEFEKKQKEEQAKQQKPAEEKPGSDKPKEDAPATQPATQPASAPASQPAFEPPKIDPAYQPLVDLIQKKDDKALFALIQFNDASDYLHLRQVLEQFEIDHAFMLRNRGGTDLYRVAKQLGEQEARVVLLPMVNTIPYSAERLLLMRDLSTAGCEVSVLPAGDNGPEHARLFKRLAELVRHGWAREDALKSVTLHPARLLGVDDRFGTIEKDKDADLVFFDGDPLDGISRVREVMIAGEMVHETDPYETAYESDANGSEEIE